MPVIVQKAVIRDVPIPADYVARTVALQTVDVRARVSGVLQAIDFVEGGAVREGQVLFQIQPEEYQAALLTAQAQLAQAQADLLKAQQSVATLRAQAALAQQVAALNKANRDVDRLRPLAKAQAVPQTDLDTALTTQQVASSGVLSAQAAVKDSQLTQRVAILQAQAAIDSARAAVTTAQLNLSYTQIRSPLTGIAGFVKVDKGNVINPQDRAILTTVSTTDPMQVLFSLSEQDFLRVQKDLQNDAADEDPVLTLVLADNEVYPYKGRPQHLDRAIDQKTGTLSVSALFPNPGGTLRPGQFGRVRFNLEHRPNSIVIPRKAVQTVLATYVAYVVGADNKVKQRTVLLGPQVGNDVIILDGISAGESVIVEGIQKVRPGSTVIPKTVAAK